MLIARIFSRIFSVLLFLPNSNRGDMSAEEDAREVVRFLEAYRTWREERDSVVVETPYQLSDQDKQDVRDFLQISNETKVVEKISPALSGSFQVVYRGRVHAYHSSNSLHKLKEFFTYS